MREALEQKEQAPPAGVKIREDKKREILMHIENHTGGSDLLEVERGEICRQFSDDDYPEERIDGIINEMVEDGPLGQSEFKLELLHPKSAEESLYELVDPVKEKSLFWMFSFGFYMLFIATPLIENTSLVASASRSQFILSAMVGILASYSMGRASFGLFEAFSSRVPIVRKYKTGISCFTIICVSEILLGWWLTDGFTTGNANILTIAIIPSSLIAAATVAKYIGDVKQDDEE